MTSVGIRELKAHLAEYIRRAERGESITVTDRGRAVARLVPEPVAELTTEEKLRQLVAEGFLDWSGEKPELPELVGPVSPGFSLSDIVVEERDAHVDRLADIILGKKPQRE